LLEEEGEEIMKNLTIFIENMLDELYFDYSKRLKSLFKVTDE
jgi:hypothetical protein